MKKKESFLVTGIAGLIGSALARKLLENGNKVVGVDNLSTGLINNIPEGSIFIKGDIQDLDTINQLYSWNFDTIFHIAGQSSGEISFEDPVYDLQTNCQSTLYLLELARRTKCKTFVYASTMSVYGDLENPDLPVTEESPVRPKSFYAIGKYASEEYMRIYSENYGLDCTALRLFNVYGPGQNMSNFKQGMVSIFLAYAINGKNIIVKGSSSRFRDQVFIDDAVNAFIESRHISSLFKVYNVCTGIKTTVDHILSELKKHGFRNEIIFSDGTRGDQFGIVGSSALFQKDSNWKPLTTFNEGLEKMILFSKNGNL